VSGDPEILESIERRKSESVDGAAVDLAARPMSVEDTSVPFGDGSMHTKTARWVVSQMLPEVRWYDDGRICEGVGWFARTPEISTK